MIISVLKASLALLLQCSTHDHLGVESTVSSVGEVPDL